MNVSGTALRGTLAGARGLAGVADLPVKKPVCLRDESAGSPLAQLEFSAEKRLWVLDEPFAALDTASVRRTEAVVLAHLRSGGMVLFTTHQEVELAGAQVQSLELGRSNWTQRRAPPAAPS